MPVYFYWGEDSYRLNQACQTLREKLVDPAWESFNFEKLPGEQSDTLIQAITQALTPPFGSGQRLVWVQETTVGQRCSAELLAELERTLPLIPDTSHLLLTSSAKPDGRSKAVKFLQQQAKFLEFSLIPAWKTEDLEQHIKTTAKGLGLELTLDAVELLIEAVGNDTRQLVNELEKLRLYLPPQTAITAQHVQDLVTTTTQNSLELASTILKGQVGKSLDLLGDLLRQNEPPLRLLASLTRQFRTWLWVKLLSDAKERDPQVIAKAAEIGNPKRVYFLQKEVQPLSRQSLEQALPLLLTMELQLKQGNDPQITLPMGIIQLCQCFGQAGRG
ncbi:DNA polymerase III subunit delta [Thermosynechococcaceae cyanobacterium BACA0444]|uniref:DNA polymerase III subunit delta n=1 Tax=Pseudocalidococcus azoricus BACA0444 TaxID=2918990 RepID=A0AAE4JW71_9CYAN|nr:DNA polymerase III subunit delta [Pseudocalidococcus azoricus]MDS3860756.1 DNA polymerase III subunit delta [Pseudocalidococcus azoricus BACA0444]